MKKISEKERAARKYRHRLHLFWQWRTYEEVYAELDLLTILYGEHSDEVKAMHEVIGRGLSYWKTLGFDPEIAHRCNLG